MNPENNAPLSGNVAGSNKEVASTGTGEMRPQNDPKLGDEAVPARSIGSAIAGVPSASPNSQTLSVTPPQSHASESAASGQDVLRQLVARVEDIVGRTADDPHAKSELISKLKIECNYGRDIDEGDNKGKL